MKTSNNKFWMVLGILALSGASSAPVFAQGKTGNGGGGIVCRDPLRGNQVIGKVRLYDLWEGEIRYHLSIKELNDHTAINQPTLAIYNRLNKIHRLFAINVFGNFFKIQEEIGATLKLPNPNVYLSETLDSARRLMPSRCNGRPDLRPVYEQVVNYTDEGEILVDTHLYQLLDPTSSFGILLHEAVYKTLREYQGDETSELTRKIVATLLSSADDIALENLLLENFRDGLTIQGYQAILNKNLDALIERGDIARIKEHLQFEISLFGQKISAQPGATSWTIAFLNKKNPEIIHLLLSLGGNAFDINQGIGSYGDLFHTNSVIFELVTLGDATLMDKALNKYPSANLNFYHRDYLKSPLGTAFDNENWTMVEALLRSPSIDANFDENNPQWTIKSINQPSMPPLKNAIEMCKPDLVRKILSHPSFSFEKTLQGSSNSPLYWIVNGECSPETTSEMAQILLQDKRYDAKANMDFKLRNKNQDVIRKIEEQLSK